MTTFLEATSSDVPSDESAVLSTNDAMLWVSASLLCSAAIMKSGGMGGSGAMAGIAGMGGIGGTGTTKSPSSNSASSASPRMITTWRSW